MAQKMKLFKQERGLLVAALVGLLTTALGFSLAHLLGWSLSGNNVVFLSLPMGISICLLVLALIEMFCRLTAK
ncbi:hypothetical protein M3795_25045 [Ralstonia pickettii]|uniref:hypothetical protein n=1 Tax=Ralstonia pickettii TaxID=329 RepID=UPI00203B66F5|nr:hypothetical protein [Ralstonia pickettii]MCM3583740.1 hypothetical protein [Ralstonia pickettii]